MKSKSKLFLFTFIMVLFCVTTSYAVQTITAENNVELTNSKHYPVITLTNHKNKDVLVEWGACGDAYQGSILVPSKSTINLELTQLSFLGTKHETTTVWLTWTDKDFLKPRGTDVITIPFENIQNSQPQLGMK